MKDTAAIDVVKNGKKYTIKWLEGKKVIQGLNDKTRDIVDRSEIAVLNSSNERLVHTTVIRNGLTPIIEIIGLLIREDSVQVYGLEETNEKYLPFLHNKKYVKMKSNMIYRGKRLNRYYDDRKKYDDEQQLVYSILADILKEGYIHMREPLFNHATAFLTIANANLFPSYIKDERIYFKIDDFRVLEKILCDRIPLRPRIKMFNLLFELEEVGIFEVEDGLYVANEDVWKSYRAEMSA